ncbi:hypothetical protein L873DRAFT_1842102 [Choiromyces venosus 120613-1]|uniref:Uncharacterized protein n=1 Tax=Choiromyces venosus 120613-1 TaxID=1336337 RepID=A0A3N4K0J0_9PEZI|nr:hypothetical protein L873DRAFT_1842102 [Choiromyces venosus 120613-1]
MQDLYDKLWGKQLRVIEPCTFSIPHPQHGLRPEYMVDFKVIGDEWFQDLEFEKGKEDDSHGRKTDVNSLFDLPDHQKEELWILTDEALEDAGWNDKGHSWFVVLAASPAKIRGLWQWEKDRKVGSRYMSNWGWGEIVAAFSLEMPKPPTPRQMAMLFTTFPCLGPIARTCLESIFMMSDDDYNHDLKTYLGEIDREIDTFILQGGYLTLYKYLTCQDPLRSAGSWFFEGYAHDWFGKDRSFEADKLLIKDNNTHLKFMTYWSKSLNYFTNANNLATQVRVKGSQEINDLDTLILLQITIAKSYDIQLCRVKKLCESLPATIKNIHIVFVIPEDRISEYSSAQSAPEARDVKPNATDLLVNQFRLVLTEEVIHLMTVGGSFKVWDGGRGADESGSRD